MKHSPIPFLLLAMASVAVANTPPTVVIQSAVMRPGTTLMDVVYRVNDPDDATVKTRALAFVDGVRSFANVLKPVTFVEGTAAKIGDAITANVDHTLTWNVAADWSIDLGQLKFEVLAMDQRGLLPFDWITIPAAGGEPALTISKDAPTDAQVLNAYFWLYADGDTGLSLTSGELRGTAASGVFNNLDLVSKATVENYGAPFIFKRMNFTPGDAGLIDNAAVGARAGLLSIYKWHAVNRAYDGITVVAGWGGEYNSLTSQATYALNDITAIASGRAHYIALKSDGIVIQWGSTGAQVPAGLSGVKVIAIAAGAHHSLALKSDGTVFAWGSNTLGETAVPSGLSGVIAISAGSHHSLALKSNGTVVAWGYNVAGATNVPAGLSDVTALAAGQSHSLAIKSNGTVVGWGSNGFGEITIPADLSDVTAISSCREHSLALKSNGTVVAWGGGEADLNTIPVGLNGVTAIAAGDYHNLALKSNGTVVAWGTNEFGETIKVPNGLGVVTAIASGGSHSLVLKAKAP